MNGAPGKMVWLDWLRFAAAFIVLLTHARSSVFVEFGALVPEDRTLITAGWFALTRMGHEAVIVFFVLSGFLVGGKAVERALAGTFRWQDYMLDRLSRIATPLVPAIALTALVGWLAGTPVGALQVAGNLLSLQGIVVPVLAENGPLWSLPYEVWFYVMAGAACALAVAPRRSGVFKAVLVLSMAVFCVLDATLLLCWLLGALAYHRLPRRASWLEIAVALVGALCGMALWQASSGSVSLSPPAWMAVLAKPSVAEFVLAASVALLTRNLSCLRMTATMGRLGAWLAGFSYTLYLIHYPVLRLMNPDLERVAEVNAASLGLFAIRTAVCLIVAYVFYLAFERNTPAVRDWLKVRAMGRVAKGRGIFLASVQGRLRPGRASRASASKTFGDYRD